MEREATLEELLEDEVLHVFIARFGLSVDALRDMMLSERERVFGSPDGAPSPGEAFSRPSP